MGLFVSAQEQGHETAQLKMCHNTAYDSTNRKHQHPHTASNDLTTTPMIPSPSNISAITATFTTAELLEHILSYLSAPQLLTTKRTCTSFYNAIQTSPALRRKTSTFLRLGAVHNGEDDLFSTDAGGEVVFPIEGLGVLGFFYPGGGGGERRMFVRFEVGDGERFLRRVGKGGGSGFGRLRVVDQRLGDVRVGWHCGCFEEGWREVKLPCLTRDMVTFSDVLGAMEGEHRGREKGKCGSLRKLWVDGLWKGNGEGREFGRRWGE